MENKKKFKGFGSFALLAIAMLSLVGVGFAISYTGSAENTDNEMSGEAITVALSSYTNFLAGDYSVNSVNNGTTVTLSNLQKDGSATTPYTTKYFKYNAGAFTLDNTDQGYSATEAATITVTLNQTDGAKADTVNLAITGAQASVVNQYGISFVYVYDNQIFDPTDGISNIDLSSGSANLVIKAYVIYSNSVPVASIGSIAGFALANANVTFTATASS